MNASHQQDHYSCHVDIKSVIILEIWAIPPEMTYYHSEYNPHIRRDRLYFAGFVAMLYIIPVTQFNTMPLVLQPLSAVIDHFQFFYMFVDITI